MKIGQSLILASSIALSACSSQLIIEEEKFRNRDYSKYPAAVADEFREKDREYNEILAFRLRNRHLQRENVVLIDEAEQRCKQLEQRLAELKPQVRAAVQAAISFERKKK